jgi:hypothetical protein
MSTLGFTSGFFCLRFPGNHVYFASPVSRGKLPGIPGNTYLSFYLMSTSNFRVFFQFFMMIAKMTPTFARLMFQMYLRGLTSPSIKFDIFGFYDFSDCL